MTLGHISMKFTEVEVQAKFLKLVCGIPTARYNFLLNNYIIKISKDRNRCFKDSFDEETI